MRAHLATQNLNISIDAVRLLVIRPPLPINDSVISTLTNSLISKFQTVTKGDDGGWYFSTANGSASVAIAEDRAQFSINAPMDSEVVLSTIAFPIPHVLAALQLPPPYPYGIYVQCSLESEGQTSLEAICAATPVFKSLTPNDAILRGGGFRTVYDKDDQTFDCKVETLFVNPRRFFISVDANSLAKPAASIEALMQDVRAKFAFFEEHFVPLAERVLSRNG